MHPLLNLVIAIAVVFILIIRLKLNPFLALIGAAVFIGILSPQIPLERVVNEVGTRFGNVVGRIGIAIAMAAIIGQCLMESGAADKITRRFVAFLGEKYSSLSIVASGYVLSIPVFHDTVFYLLIPLARAMSVRVGGRHFVLYALSIAAGGSATHVFVPPTPGPLAMAETLNIDLGLVIIVGIVVALPASICGWFYAQFIDRKLNLPLREAPGLSLAELEEIATKPESELPGFWASLTPILLPVLLITSNTVAGTVAPESPIIRYTEFLGDPSLALILSAAVSMWLLAHHRGWSLKQLAKPVEDAIGSAGMIILITAGGGAFGGMLQAAGVGDALGEVARDFGIPLMAMAFFLAVLFKIAVGSATVCMITTASIMAPLVVAAPPPYHAVYILMMIGAGSLVGVWMNDSGFWVFRTMTGLTEVETLQTKSALLVILGLAAMVVCVIMSRVIPLV